MCNIHNFLGKLHINLCRLNQKTWLNQIQIVPQNSGSKSWEIIWKDCFDDLCFKYISPLKTIFVNLYLHIKLCMMSRNMCKLKSNLHQKTCTLTGMSCNLHIIICKTNSFYFILTSGWPEFFISPKLTKVQGSLETSLNWLDHFLLSEPVGIVYVYTELYTDRVRHHKQHWSNQSVCTGIFSDNAEQQHSSCAISRSLHIKLCWFFLSYYDFGQKIKPDKNIFYSSFDLQ